MTRAGFSIINLKIFYCDILGSSGREKRSFGVHFNDITAGSVGPPPVEVNGEPRKEGLAILQIGHGGAHVKAENFLIYYLRGKSGSSFLGILF